MAQQCLMAARVQLPQASLLLTTSEGWLVLQAILPWGAHGAWWELHGCASDDRLWPRKKELAGMINSICLELNTKPATVNLKHIHQNHSILMIILTLVKDFQGNQTLLMHTVNIRGEKCQARHPDHISKLEKCGLLGFFFSLVWEFLCCRFGGVWLVGFCFGFFVVLVFWLLFVSFVLVF